ncbi:HpcH/HpaI aldolase/citrate lyase family protein [Pseudomonas fluorescens]|uniref:HpcH/HpaI aldolase/citrate lyase family protein n=1 Tax=Pseudomonas fluorescens TaxID=294 RepID=UPI003F9C2916
MTVVSTFASLPRSYLFVPGIRPERISKALASGADNVIVDLEDAVAPGDKDRARECVIEWLVQNDASVCVRINAEDTPWYERDLQAFAQHASVGALVVPKVGSSRSLLEVQRRCRPGMALLPIIESAEGYAALQDIASCGAAQRLMFGTIDFQVDMGTDLGDEQLNPLRLQFTLASKLAGIGSPVDGVTTALDDDELLRCAAAHAKRYGFGAKLCIHPRQVSAVHLGFSPSKTECEWAKKIIAAADASGGEATVVDGAMVDLPVILKARNILACARG